MTHALDSKSSKKQTRDSLRSGPKMKFSVFTSADVHVPHVRQIKMKAGLVVLCKNVKMNIDVWSDMMYAFEYKKRNLS